MLAHFIASFPRSHFHLILDLDFENFYKSKQNQDQVLYDKNKEAPKPVS